MQILMSILVSGIISPTTKSIFLYPTKNVYFISERLLLRICYDVDCSQKVKIPDDFVIFKRKHSSADGEIMLQFGLIRTDDLLPGLYSAKLRVTGTSSHEFLVVPTNRKYLDYSAMPDIIDLNVPSITLQMCSYRFLLRAEWLNFLQRKKEKYDDSVLCRTRYKNVTIEGALLIIKNANHVQPGKLTIVCDREQLKHDIYLLSK